MREVTFGVLEETKPPKPNLSPHERKAIISLRRNKDIVILPADKGRATVILDQDSYKEKMMELLNSGDYYLCKRNPTARIELAVRTALKEAEQKELIDAHTKKWLSPYHSLTPQIYGLPKIHKPGTPLRPIVCTINSPTYEIAKMLAKILTPMTGHTNSFIKNSTHLVEELRNWRIEQEDLMVSFDVKSLFTNVPIDNALMILMERLQNDETLGDRTNLDPLCIMPHDRTVPSFHLLCL